MAFSPVHPSPGICGEVQGHVLTKLLEVVSARASHGSEMEVSLHAAPKVRSSEEATGVALSL